MVTAVFRLRGLLIFQAGFLGPIRWNSSRTLSRADHLAWALRLRGYDAVHLAAALEWNDRIGEPMIVATFDRDLWRAAGEAGLDQFPDTL